MPLWGKTDATNKRPNWVDLTLYPEGTTMVFVDQTEAKLDENKSRGISGPGWWLYRSYTDSLGNTRYKTENLVAISETALAAGDASDDAIAADVSYTITIGTQPASQGFDIGDTKEVGVAASVTSGGGTLTYQWQSKVAETTRWVNISGATSSTYTTPTLAQSNNGDMYRVKIKSSNGAKEVTSAAATLTWND